MPQRHNVSKLLHTATSTDPFLKQLNITERQETQLLSVRKKVRSALKQGFKELRDRANEFYDSDQLYLSRLAPKFWTQGSYVYRTLNRPEHLPPQQIDIDDGVYFPMELVEGNPKAANRLLFNSVENILKKLADSNNWAVDTNKSTCVRIIVDAEMHVDIPIYAIPEERYAVLKATVESRQFDGLLSAEATDDNDIWLNPSQVYLAVRDKDKWKPSDPMVLQRWFEGRCKVHSNRLRRICRYLKGWRDLTWIKGGPSSITLMVAAAETFDNNLNTQRTPFQSDCEALLAVARELPDQFAKNICNPEEPEEVMFPRNLKDEEIVEIRNKVRLFKGNVEISLCHSQTSHEVVAQLQAIFGQRIPSRPDLVKLMPVAAAVRKIPAQKQDKPKPSKTNRSA